MHGIFERARRAYDFPANPVAAKRDHHWYYRSIARILLEKEPESRLFRTLDFET